MCSRIEISYMSRFGEGCDAAKDLRKKENQEMVSEKPQE